MQQIMGRPAGLSRKRLSKKNRRWVGGVSVAIAIGLWQLIVILTDLPAFILPPPGLVWNRFWQVFIDGSLIYHAVVTLLEVFMGLLVGGVLAVVLGYLLAKRPFLEELLSPYLVAIQAVPVVAIAPLLVIWFGPGMFSKVLICALTIFFPMLVNTIVGMRAVSRDLRALMRSMKASPWQMLRYLELPAALPVLLGGLRIGATLSVIGAVVGEFVGADKGLGFLVNVGRGQYDTALVFVAIFALAAMALCLYGVVRLIETDVLTWQTTSEQIEE